MAETTQNKDLLQEIIDVPNIGLTIYRAVRDNEGNIIDFIHEFINQKANEALGHDFTGRLLSDRGPDSIKQIDLFRQVIETQKSNKYTLKSESGTVHQWFRFSNTPLQNDRVLHIWEDITALKNTEIKIHENRELLASLLNNTASCIMVLKPVINETGHIIDFEYTYVNKHVLKSVSRKELVGKYMLEEFPRVKDSELFHRYAEVLKTGNDLRQEFDISKYGRDFWTQVYAHKMGDNLLVTYFDITEAKKAEELLEHEAKLLTDLNKAGNRLWCAKNLEAGLQEMLLYVTSLFNTNMSNLQLIDPDKQVLTIAASKGFSKEFLDYFQEVSAEDGSVCAQAFKSRQQVAVEDVAKDKSFAPHLPIAQNAGFRSVLSTPLYAQDGSPIGMISVHRKDPGQFTSFDLRIMELYAQKAESFIESCKADEALKKLNIELENKVQERTLELTQLLEQEKALNEMKSVFVSTASHEFRTPLTTILSSASLIDSYYHEDEHKERRSIHISRIKVAVNHLIDILNDFLSVDKLEQGKMEKMPERFNLYEFAEEIVEEVNGMLKTGQKIQFSCKRQETIVQDKRVLKNVLLNLLSNAIKYSGENKKIRFLIEIHQNIASIKVKDHGVGIPKNEQAKLFTKFFRASNVTNIQGTGLGLNIVKKYVELLNGTIDFTSKVNEGTTFTITFPTK